MVQFVSWIVFGEEGIKCGRIIK